MTELKGFEEPVGTARPLGVPGRADVGKKNWKEEREQEIAELGHSRQPYCLIIGGGQGGIGLAARLRQLNVPTIIVEKNERAGDSWRKRYKSLCLHDPVWYDHMPYLPFPKNWPVFSPKDKIGDWLEMYTKVMELNYWGSTECKSASFDDKRKEWTVVVAPRRQGHRAETQAAGFRHRHGEQAHRPRLSRAATYSRASSIIRPGIPARMPMPASASW